MVLFKRKRVQYVPQPPSLFEDQEIWAIDETGEVFTNYDDFTARMDFYKQKRFICEVTGHSGLDYFDALEYEAAASRELDDEFSDALRGPILRKVQHSTISRIDNLVDYVYNVSGSLSVLGSAKRQKAFKHSQNIVEGERVVCTVDDPGWGKLYGEVREKVDVGGDALPGESSLRFFVTLDGMTDKEALVDAEHIWRERKTFTKQILRSFLKNSLDREAWLGAPWCVKDHLATKHKIDTRIPQHLTYDYQVAQRKLTLNHKKSENDGTIINFFGPSKGFPDIKPKTARKHASGGATDFDRDHIPFSGAFERMQGISHTNGQLTNGDARSIQFVNQHPELPSLAAKGAKQAHPPPPPIKYPREDLENNPTGTVRPELKFLSDDPPTSATQTENGAEGILQESIGLLLETWDTLNVYCEVFMLDSFTFDDYVDALQTDAEDTYSELLTEIHCALLKKLVNHEREQNGRVQIHLPDEESSEEESETNTPEDSPEPEPERQTRTTRGSVSKKEAAELKAQAAAEAQIHQAAEVDQCVKGYGWKARLQKRDFANGRWVIIIVGLLSLFSSHPAYKADCEAILKQLAPIKMEATEETVISQYQLLDINLRVKILQILCMLSMDTQAIRNYMEDCTAAMTKFRKKKIDWQRKKKQLVEDLKVLEEERSTLAPDKPSHAVNIEELEKDQDPDATENGEDADTTMEDTEEDAAPPRNRRRANIQAAEKKRKFDDERKRKAKEEAEKAKKANKEARQLEKVLKKISDAEDEVLECEAEIETCDNDLRENDCPRTRVLGKDRFWNRYYWFERNAMPYGGLPDSSTAHAGYANGRLWVQGPDDIERTGFIDLDDADNARYRAAFGVTVPQRKLDEEGATHTFTARQWGYYDEPAAVDQLLAWLSDKGSREIKLRKDLTHQRDRIVTYMQHRHAYLAGGEAGGDEDGRRMSEPPPTTRVSTRTKAYAAAAADPDGPRFRAWRNTAALRELGHLHAEAPRAPRKGVARPVNGKKAAVDEGRQTRSSGRQGKPLGRHGTRYTF